VILHAPLCPTWIKVAWEGSKDVASLHTCSKVGHVGGLDCMVLIVSTAVETASS
jgi:hypothetical protein